LPRLVLAAVVSILVAGCAAGPKVGAQIPEVSVLDAAGTTVALGPGAGDAALIYFWATWCGPCALSGPAVQSLHERYEGRGLRVVGVHYDATGDPQAYMAEQGHTFELIPDGRGAVAAFGVKKIPQIVVVDGAGKVVYTQIGFTAGDEVKIAAAVESQLGEGFP
jgi:peroxiredoxin